LWDPLVLGNYRKQFPQLWQNHDLVLRLDQITGKAQPLLPPRSSEPGDLNDSDLPLFPSQAQSFQGYVFRLFVSGHGLKTEKTLQHLHQLLEEQLTVPYTLKVIDIVKHPEQAEQNQVTAIPTLIRVWPKPIHRLVGHFERSAQLLQVLKSQALV
jgi:circadian clock protein KaiB